MKRLLLLSLVLLGSVGCMRPYDVPEFAEIENFETGYLIPLEGATKEKQGKFDSEEALEANKVAVKRVQIPHRWVSTGRVPGVGEYLDQVRLVVVNRTPETREWTADAASGTTTKNQAIWLESRDSISFSLGFNCTAFVDSPDSTRFLYTYPTTRQPNGETLGYDKSVAELSHVMDTEIRARVQMLANAVAAKYDLDDLRARKTEILHAVRNGIPEVTKDGAVVQEKLMGTVEHFAQRGITITTLGQFGGFEYEDETIQTAINDTFIAQQEKVRTEAAFEAQQKKNERIELEANALAERARRIAQGEADAIRMVAEATKEAGQDPLFLELKKLDVEEKRVETWDGVYPQTFLGGGGDTPGLLLNMN